MRCEPRHVSDYSKHLTLPNDERRDSGIARATQLPAEPGGNAICLPAHLSINRRATRLPQAWQEKKLLGGC